LDVKAQSREHLGSLRTATWMVTALLGRRRAACEAGVSLRLQVSQERSRSSVFRREAFETSLPVVEGNGVRPFPTTADEIGPTTERIHAVPQLSCQMG
jgi:hypothetical protein